MFGFGKALDVLRDGDSVTRQGWKHPEVVFGLPSRVMLMDRNAVSSSEADPEPEPRDTVFAEQLVIVTAGLDEDWVRPWAPTHEDLLAEDWDYVR
jgi:hypothetical protein